jgi:DNA repair protein RecO (recombination protein O)
MAIQKTEGIILKKRDFRETSITVAVYTKGFGKLRGVLKGIKQTPGKFGTFPDLFSRVHLVFYEKSNAAFYLISQLELLDSYSRIRKSLQRCAGANYVIELLDLICPDYEPNEGVFNLTRLTLDRLNSAEIRPASDIQKLTNVFKIKLLNLAGFKPRLDDCIVCKKEIVNYGFFSSQLGGVLCEECRPHAGAVRPISRGAIASIRYIENSDWRTLKNLKLMTKISRELDYILAEFLSYNLEKEIQSREFLNKLSVPG